MKQITVILFCFMSLSFIFTSCEEDMSNDPHYKVPSGPGAQSAWEVLTEKGNYSVFLKGAEDAGFKALLEGRSLLTVMAPDDTAFSAYLNEKGYSDISEVDKEELSKLIGFHLLYYSYPKERLVNFCPDGDLATADQLTASAGEYFKFRTWSSSAPTMEKDSLGIDRMVYHLDRFIPVFSHLFFEKRGIDPIANYEYFYPGSTWTGGNDGFNVSNASVVDYAIPTTNGYIYTIDRVLKPLETIYTEMKNRQDYSIFFDLYNDYTKYVYDATLSSDYGATIGVDSLYLHRHDPLAPIAMEWPVSSFQSIKVLAYGGYSIFSPSNNAMNGFFEDYWKTGGYNSLAEVDPLLMEYFLLQFSYAGSMVLPGQIINNEITNPYGHPFDYFDLATAKDRVICVNGTFYGLDDFQTPSLFKAVVGPAFQYRNYLTYLYVLHQSRLLESYISNDTDYAMLIPDTTQMVESGYHLITNDLGTFLRMDSEDGPVAVPNEVVQDMVSMHTVTGISGLESTGTHVYPVQASFSYLFVKDGKITSNALFNSLLQPEYVEAGSSPFTPFTEITDNGASWSNGKAYAYESPVVFSSESSPGLSYALAICNDNRYPYNSFVQLLKKAGLVVTGTTPTIPILMTGRFIAFIPTNEAVATAIANNEIPGITDGTTNPDGTIAVDNANFDIEKLKEYLQSYFLRSSENAIVSYPYPGSAFRTSTYTAANLKKLEYTDNGNTLSVKLEGGSSQVQVISKYDYFPFAFKDGCFHFIEKVF